MEVKVRRDNLGTVNRWRDRQQRDRWRKIVECLDHLVTPRGQHVGVIVENVERGSDSFAFLGNDKVFTSNTGGAFTHIFYVVTHLAEYFGEVFV